MKTIQHPLTMFLVGATGDLAKKKIFKAVYSLAATEVLPSVFTLIGIARKEMSRAEFQTYVHDIVQPNDEKIWQRFAEKLQYVSGDVSQQHVFDQLNALHANMTACGNHLWYIATLPRLYEDIIDHLGRAKLNQVKCGWTKVLLEKPFGTDAATAKELNKHLHAVFEEKQIYRIDHFLAKETVQNLLVFRFANGIFEDLWQHKYVDHIQITSAETLGVEGREIFYDQTGTVRDVIQNHVLQMLAMTMMDEPQSLQADDIRARRQQLLEALRPLPNDIGQHARFGQYQSGEIDGVPVRSYLDEKNITPNSRTETAVAFRCFVDNQRWNGVPIYIRAGKRLARNVTEISIQFKEPKNAMFSAAGFAQTGNVLTLRIQPNEGIVIRLKVKEPGLQLSLQDVPMQFCYKNEFQMGLVEAYEKLIYDAVEDDATLFSGVKGIEAAWEFVDPLLKFKATHHFELDSYAAGSWGPASFDELIVQDKRSWIEPSIDVCAI